MMTARHFGAQRGVEGWVWQVGDANWQRPRPHIRLLTGTFVVAAPVDSGSRSAVPSIPTTVPSIPTTGLAQFAGKSLTLNGVTK